MKSALLHETPLQCPAHPRNCGKPGGCLPRVLVNPGALATCQGPQSQGPRTAGSCPDLNPGPVLPAVHPACTFVPPFPLF